MPVSADCCRKSVLMSAKLMIAAAVPGYDSWQLGNIKMFIVYGTMHFLLNLTFTGDMQISSKLLSFRQKFSFYFCEK